jgi:hypothetical protein
MKNPNTTLRSQPQSLTATLALSLLMAVSLSARAQNYLRDGSFELQTSSTVASPWQVEKDSRSPATASIQRAMRTSYVGNNNAYLANTTTSWIGLRQTVSGLSAYGRYRLEGMIKCSTNVVSGYFGVRTAAGSIIKQTIYGGKAFAGYKFVTVDFMLDSATSVVVFAGFRSPGTSAMVQLDNLILRPIDSNMNVVDDPGFESQTSAWSLNAPWVAVGSTNSGAGTESGLGTAASGDKNAWLSANIGYSEIYQKIPVQAGTSYQATAKVRTSANFSGGVFGLRNRYFTPGPGVSDCGKVSFGPSTAGYSTVTFYFTGTSGGVDGSVMFELYLGFTASVSTWMRIDDISVTPVASLPVVIK